MSTEEKNFFDRYIKKFWGSKKNFENNCDDESMKSTKKEILWAYNQGKKGVFSK